MKKLTLFYILMNVSLLAFPQAIHIFHDGEKIPDIIANAEIDSIYYAPKFGESAEYQQVFATKDGEKRYDVVDSVKFNLPHLLLPRHDYYIPASSDNGYIILWMYCNAEDTPEITRSDGTKVDFYSYSNYADNYWNERWYSYRYCRECWPRSFRNDDDIVEDSVHTETWYITSGELKDSITLHFTNEPFSNNVYKDVCLSGDEQEYTIELNWPEPFLNPVIFSHGEDTFVETQASWYVNEEGKPVVCIPKNESGEKRSFMLFLSAGGFTMIDGYIDQYPSFMHTSEEHKAALREFCDSTDFENWGKETNWWSEEPLWKWDYYINQRRDDSYYYQINDHIASLNFD